MQAQPIRRVIINYIVSSEQNKKKNFNSTLSGKMNTFKDNYMTKNNNYKTNRYTTYFQISLLTSLIK